MIVSVDGLTGFGDAIHAALDELEENWGKKYPASITSWRNNWPQLTI